MSLSFDVFVVIPKPIPSAVPGFENVPGGHVTTRDSRDHDYGRLRAPGSA
jgi:hypothetical protein